MAVSGRRRSTARSTRTMTCIPEAKRISVVLPAFRQEGSYFACQNKHWTLVGLDVAYQDHDIDDQQVAWLKQILAKAGDRKVVLFSHHQLYSHFESRAASSGAIRNSVRSCAAKHLRLVLGP